MIRRWSKNRLGKRERAAFKAMKRVRYRPVVQHDERAVQSRLGKAVISTCRKVL